ncbi:MAG: ribonuclease HI family protein [Peptococcaceae bacterium]|nr:ribonuclease HI family protein [Peptococcaceae bacterium]
MYKAYVDGACRPNPGRGAYGFIIYDPKGVEIKRENGSVGEKVTNNIAEYTAVIKAIRSAVAMGVGRLAVFSDSQLVVKQLNGDYRVHDPQLKKLHTKALSLLEWFEQVELIHISRKRNRLADALANEYYSQTASFVAAEG